MRFIDECDLRVEAGDGGNGCIAFRRERYQPFGGPSGGDGGRGGSVHLRVDTGKNTLFDLSHLRVVKAERGEHGLGSDCYGRAGSDVEVRVPQGTVVHDAETGALLCELLGPDDEFLAAEGGRGGRGNIHFATSTDRAPRRADPGGAGQRRTLRLTLKVMADVGLLGFPNVGKSTFISVVSRARPKVADYPFTTLEPHLGVAVVGDASRGLGRSFVIADIPGLIPGASQGAGLGIQFLRHVQRTRVLLHLVTVTEEPGRDPLTDYRALRHELAAFDPELAERPELIALTRMDLPFVREAFPEWEQAFAAEGLTLHALSSATGEGVQDMLRRLVGALDAPTDRAHP